MLGKQRTELGADFSWGWGPAQRLLTGQGLAGAGCGPRRQGGPRRPPRVTVGLQDFAWGGGGVKKQDKGRRMLRPLQPASEAAEGNEAERALGHRVRPRVGGNK